MPPQLTCFCFLDNTELSILKVQLKDDSLGGSISSDPKSSAMFIAKWLMLNKATGMITTLEEKSKDASGDIVEHYFEQGYLKFNWESATFIEKFNYAQHQLLRLPADLLPQKLTIAIEAFLSRASQH